MTFDPKILDGGQYACDPVWLGRYVARAVLMPCPSAREVVLFRKQRLDDIHATMRSASKRRNGAEPRVGVIPVYGPLDQRQNAALMKMGGTSTEEIGLYLDYLVNDSSVSSVLLDIDSPGGNIYGVEELADQIVGARGTKKIWGIANSMAASAGYWVGSAAQRLYMTPGGDVGSVGVYCVHVDESQALSKQGLSVSIIKAGKFKAETAPTAPLSPEARDHLQEMVDATYAKFVRSLAHNRGVSQQHVREQFGQGRTLNADQALAAKMVDGIMTYNEVLEKMGGQPTMPERRSASLSVVRARHERMKVKVASF